MGTILAMLRSLTISTLCLAAAFGLKAQSPTFAGCPIFPSNNVWNTRIDQLPVDRNSAAYIASANATNNKLHPDFGHGTLLTGGMPYNIVPGSQPKFPVSFYYTGDPGPYPIPSSVNIELGSDHHVILIDNTNCVLYELFNLSGLGSIWSAGSGAIWSLKSNALRSDNQNSADAAGLPIFPGLVRYDEVASGHINHALRVTIDHTRNGHIWPARSEASSLNGTQYPPMGQRFRLKASYDISSYPAPVRVILTALKQYGMILADNGTSWHLSGIGDESWNDDVMHTMTNVTGDNFEAVDESSLMVSLSSGQAGGTLPIATGSVHVVSKNSGKCLDMAGGPGATQGGVLAQQWTCLGSSQSNQLFQFTAVGSNQYKLTVNNSGLGLQVLGPYPAANGTRIEQWAYSGQSYQKWLLVKTSDGYYEIQPANNSGSCLDVRAYGTNNGAAVQQWTCTGNNNQKWSLVPVQ